MYDLGRFEPWGKPLSHGPAGRDSSPHRGAKSRGGRRTREERRRARYAAVCRAVVVVGFVLALLLFLGMLGPEEDPLPGAQVGEDVATFYAAEEYDRIMAEWGDSGAARRGAEIKYQEVLAGWSAK